MCIRDSSNTAAMLLRDMPCEAAIALPDRPSARSCNTSFALIFRTITDCSFRRVPYTRGGRSLEAGGPHGRYCWPPSAIFAIPATGPRRQYRWTPVRRIFKRTHAGLEAARARGRVDGRSPLLSGDKLLGVLADGVLAERASARRVRTTVP